MKSFRIKRIEDYIPEPASDSLFLLPTDPAGPCSPASSASPTTALSAQSVTPYR